MNISDRRRLLGPLNAKLPTYIDSTSTKAQTTKKDDEIRKIFLKTGLVGNANGSAYLEVDDTIIEVSVFGPRPIRGSFIDRASFSVECKFLPYISQPNEAIYDSEATFNNNGKPGLTNVEQRISTYLETSLLPSILLEKYPKSTIDLFVTIISTKSTPHSNSCLLHLCSWISNCSSLALVDAGIECRDIVTSGQVRLNMKQQRVILDPIYNQDTEAEDQDCIDGVFSFMNMKNDEIVGFWIEGNQYEVDEEVMNKLVEGCKTMSNKVRANINSYLINL